MSAAAAITTLELPSELRLWQREVEMLTSLPEPPAAAVREMLRTVLLALAVDPASNSETRADVRRMLAVVDPTSVPSLTPVPH
jgi:hypothetical protein